MIRKRLLKRLDRKYIIAGLVVISLVLAGLIAFSAIGSSDGEGLDTPTVEEPADEETETRELTEHRLVRIDAKGAGWLGGVLAGFAFYFGFPLWLLRLLFVVAVIWWDDASEFFIIAYILLWIFMPSIDFIPADFIARTG